MLRPVGSSIRARGALAVILPSLAGTGAFRLEAHRRSVGGHAGIGRRTDALFAGQPFDIDIGIGNGLCRVDPPRHQEQRRQDRQRQQRQHDLEPGDQPGMPVERVGHFRRCRRAGSRGYGSDPAEPGRGPVTKRQVILRSFIIATASSARAAGAMVSGLRVITSPAGTVEQARHVPPQVAVGDDALKVARGAGNANHAKALCRHR